MKRTITRVFSVGQVLNILARHIIESEEIEVNDDFPLTGELMAVAEKDSAGSVGITQYRIEIEFQESKESWRG